MPPPTTTTSHLLLMLLVPLRATSVPAAPVSGSRPPPAALPPRTSASAERLYCRPRASGRGAPPARLRAGLVGAHRPRPRPELRRSNLGRADAGAERSLRACKSPCPEPPPFGLLHCTVFSHQLPWCAVQLGGWEHGRLGVFLQHPSDSLERISGENSKQ